jgi:hypothetical protein
VDTVNARLLKPFVWDYVIALLQSPEAFEEKLRQAQTQEMQNITPKQYELEILSHCWTKQKKKQRI